MASDIAPLFDYLGDLEKAVEEIGNTWHPDSPEYRADVYRQIMMQFSYGYFAFFHADAEHPDWAPLWNPVYTLQPNPDDIYLYCPIRSDLTYRISGKRGSVYMITFNTQAALPGLPGPIDHTGEHYSDLDDGDLQIDADGNFEILLSAGKPAGHEGNWLQIKPGASVLMTRYRSYDWLNEAQTFPNVVNWLSSSTSLSDQNATINQTFADGSTLAQWLTLPSVNASATVGQIALQTLRHDFNGVNAPTQSWMALANGNVMQFTFNTPVSQSTGQCGRVLFNEYHVETNITNSNGRQFPGLCGASTSMTPQERRHPELIKGSRRLRIAKGSGVDVAEVNRLLKSHRQMADAFKMMSRGGGKGFSLSRYMHFMRGKDRVAWPTDLPVDQTTPAPRVPLPAIPGSRAAPDPGTHMRVTWIGHSTVLIQTQGLNILTDPVWSDVVSPFPSLVGPRRVRAPGVRFADLPKIDLVLVSHDHYDHMDLPTLAQLWARDHPLIVTSLGNDTILKWHGIASVARDWGQRVHVRPGIDVIVERVHHWGTRWGADRDRALWSGFTVTLPGGNLFFAGDTGPGDMKWPGEAAAHGPVRFAILPIGAIAPANFMHGNHINPDDAVTIFQKLGAWRALGVHWGTFQLSYEAFDDPPRLLRASLAAHHVGPDRFLVLRPGAPWDIPEMRAGS